MELKISVIDSSILWEKSVSKRQAIKEVSDAASNLVASNDYGESIEKMLVGLIVVEPVYDDFSKPRRPRYTEHKETKAFGSIPIVIHKTLEIEIKLDYGQVLASEEEELKRIVASEVLNALHNLKVPKKVTDFDKDRFVADIDGLFRQMFLK
ncbi:MAG: hypothetical protein IKX35_07315 [Bacteroidales bacterium]|nr:hypothetical protein [Bacteroidales bacterium]